MKIKIHSMVDVITNSSSVTYVRANEKSIDTIKELINELILIIDPELMITADDLFTFELMNEDFIYRYVNLCRSTFEKLPEFDSYRTKWNKEDSHKLWKLARDMYEKHKKEGFNQEWVEEIKEELSRDNYSSISISVTPRNNNKHLNQIAKILSNLQELFSYESFYNG